MNLCVFMLQFLLHETKSSYLPVWLMDYFIVEIAGPKSSLLPVQIILAGVPLFSCVYFILKILIPLSDIRPGNFPASHPGFWILIPTRVSARPLSHYVKNKINGFFCSHIVILKGQRFRHIIMRSCKVGGCLMVDCSCGWWCCGCCCRCCRG